MIGGFILAGLMILLGRRSLFQPHHGQPVGWYYISNPLLPVDYVLFCSVVWVLLLGTGRFSLWQEDDHWLNRYDGA